MKKMKLVTKGLVLLMMGVMLAGCSDSSEASEESSKQEAASKEAAMSVENSGSSEEKQGSTEESESQQQVIDDIEETKSSSEAETKPTIETPETETKNPDAGVQVPSDYADLEKEYNDYFQNVQMEGKQFVFDMDMSSYGMDVTLSMRFGAKDGASFMYIGLPTNGSNEENGFELYVMKDSTAYLRMAFAGQDPVIYKTEHLSDDNASSLNFAEGLVDIEQGDRNVKLTYDHAETVNGVKYDVLKSEDDYYVYMNSQTKEWEIMKVTQDDQDYLIYVKSIDGVTLPDGYKTAKVIDEEEFASNMMMGLMTLLISTGSYNLD